MTPGRRDLDEAEALDWLRLIRSENVGPRTFKTLLDRYGSAGAALKALPGLAKKATSRAITVCSAAEAEAEWLRARKLNIRFVALCEDAYPEALRAIDAPPPLLAVAGRVDVLARPIVGIVGSRNASATGLILTERLARGVAEAGYVVASGLARGIDVKAHMATLDTGTVAVLAGGHLHIYPSEHEGLARRICEHGALVSEMPLGWEPRARDFPRRNRIVAGLGLGVIVVEASRRSGSLITARFANEQGRDVFAVPGSPLDPRSEGTNDLIRQGATLCTSAEDVVAALAPRRDASPEALGEADRAEPEGEPLWDELDLFGDAAPEAAGGRAQAFAEADPPRRPEPRAGDGADAGAGTDATGRLAALLGPAPVSVDELIRASGLPPRAVQAALVELELAGTVARHEGNRVARRIEPAA
ncbi:DNA-processing protein DprA [Lichenibacterium ramalinae]|uniref:DNA-protecting protein DprA n=1 Tax=Lichenibacterium ramalinae TaxID=2316527 RepID=A0A4Q2REC1_9HYPH|nr:DNA-processing protein DprA [Lichenibacterium ramalinae]RYB04965.1 DNA-protecting protein DprA [Lichenibacterium ramalinae]